MKNNEFETQVASVFSMLRTLNSTYDATADATVKNTLPQIDKFSGKIFYWTALAPLIVGFCIIALFWFSGKKTSVGFIALILVSVGYLGIIAFQIALFIEEWEHITSLFRNPLTVILNRVEKETILDYTKLAAISDSERNVLRHVRRHLVTERESFERRIGVVVGALEKVGLIPGFVTLYLAWAKLEEQKYSIDIWVAVGVFILYFFAFYCHYLFTRMDRYIGTIDEIIEAKERTLTTPKP